MDSNIYILLLFKDSFWNSKLFFLVCWLADYWNFARKSSQPDETIKNNKEVVKQVAEKEKMKEEDVEKAAEAQTAQVAEPPKTIEQLKYTYIKDTFTYKLKNLTITKGSNIYNNNSLPWHYFSRLIMFIEECIQCSIGLLAFTAILRWLSITRRTRLVINLSITWTTIGVIAVNKLASIVVVIIAAIMRYRIHWNNILILLFETLCDMVIEKCRISKGINLFQTNWTFKVSRHEFFLEIDWHAFIG